jgi:hypothetical protein
MSPNYVLEYDRFLESFSAEFNQDKEKITSNVGLEIAAFYAFVDHLSHQEDRNSINTEQYQSAFGLTGISAYAFKNRLLDYCSIYYDNIIIPNKDVLFLPISYSAPHIAKNNKNDYIFAFALFFCYKFFSPNYAQLSDISHLSVKDASEISKTHEFRFCMENAFKRKEQNAEQPITANHNHTNNIDGTNTESRAKNSTDNVETLTTFDFVMFLIMFFLTFFSTKGALRQQSVDIKTTGLIVLDWAVNAVPCVFISQVLKRKKWVFRYLLIYFFAVGIIYTLFLSAIFGKLAIGTSTIWWLVAAFIYRFRYLIRAKIINGSEDAYNHSINAPKPTKRIKDIIQKPRFKKTENKTTEKERNPFKKLYQFIVVKCYKARCAKEDNREEKSINEEAIIEEQDIGHKDQHFFATTNSKSEKKKQRHTVRTKKQIYFKENDVSKKSWPKTLFICVFCVLLSVLNFFGSVVVFNHYSTQEKYVATSPNQHQINFSFECITGSSSGYTLETYVTYYYNHSSYKIENGDVFVYNDSFNNGLMFYCYVERIYGDKKATGECRIVFPDIPVIEENRTIIKKIYIYDGSQLKSEWEVTVTIKRLS